MGLIPKIRVLPVALLMKHLDLIQVTYLKIKIITNITNYSYRKLLIGATWSIFDMVQNHVFKQSCSK